MPLTIRGQFGDLRWSYQLAGKVKAWTVSKPDDGPWTLTGTLGATDTFRLSQRPLVFEVDTANGSWRWPVVALQTIGASLTAVLGPKEK